MRGALRDLKIRTVCEEASSPIVGGCCAGLMFRAEYTVLAPMDFYEIPNGVVDYFAIRMLKSVGVLLPWCTAAVKKFDPGGLDVHAYNVEGRTTTEASTLQWWRRLR